jgi:hypothetical protein
MDLVAARADAPRRRAVKFVLALVIAAVAIGYFSHRASTAFHDQGKKSEQSISQVGNLLGRAASGKPLDGRPAPDGRWVARMTAACARREDLLSPIPRSGTASGVAVRGERILAVQRAYAARVKSIRPPAAYKAEGRDIRKLNEKDESILARVVAAARSGDLGLATRESVALRELAGRANAAYLALGLDRCAFGSSGMPL